MGVTFVKAKVMSLAGKASVEGDFLVDTGAQYTVVPRWVVEKLKLKPRKIQEFVLADGQVVSRPIGTAILRFGGQETPTPIVLGEEKDSFLLGAVTLEELGLAVNPFTREIYSMKLMHI